MACWFEYNGKRYEPDDLVGALKDMKPVDAAKFIPGIKPVPEAPFQKGWHELALKRAIHEAASNGYDRLSWTPGEAQAARYDLSKQLDSIVYNKVTHQLEGHKRTSLDPVIEQTVPPEKLADAIGKEAADRLLNSPTKSKGDQVMLSGDGLRIGGEGMKGFYDQMIPKALEKLVKEHGVKVQRGDLGDGAKIREYQTNGGETRFKVTDKDGEVGTYRTRAEADAAAKESGGGSPIWYIDIPPSLREQALTKGFSLFEDSAAAGAGMSALAKQSKYQDGLHGVAKNHMIENADLLKELANKARTRGWATGKDAPGWNYNRPDAPKGSWQDTLDRTKAKWETDKSRAKGTLREAAPRAYAPKSEFMSDADWQAMYHDFDNAPRYVRADGGAVEGDEPMRRASGGKVMTDDEFMSAGAPSAVMTDDDFMNAKPAAVPSSGGFMPSWTPKAVTDIPSEIYKAGSDAVEGMSNLVPGGPRDRTKEGFFEGPLKTARGVLAIPEFLFSPFTGAARSAIGHPLAAVEDAGNRFNNKPVDEEASYARAKGDVDKAMMAARPAGRPIRAPAGPSQTTTMPNGASITTTPQQIAWESPTARQVPTPTQPETIGDLGIPLTEGEAAGDFSKVARERRALRGGEGPGAQRVAEDFMAHRDEELARARGDISRSFDPAGSQLVETPHEAAQMAGAGIRQTADDLKAASRARYDEMSSLPGEFDAAAFQGVGTRIKNRLSAGSDPVIIDDKITPIASRALDDIDTGIGQLRVQNKADPRGQPSVDEIVGINLKGVDQARKRLISMYQAAKGPMGPTPDTRAMGSILRAFDEQVEGAIMKGLFSGDPRALDALREARGLHRQYKQMFTSQGSGDDVGRVMQHITGSANREPATPTEIANYLYGSSNVGAKGVSFRVAERLKEVLGTQSPEWSAVKQGLFSRLTETPPGVTDWGPQKAANNIDKFLNGDGAALAKRMYDPAQRDLMQRYADVLRQTIPPPGAVNYSNNLQWATQMREGMTKWLTAMAGHHLGGTAGAVLGYAAGALGQPIANAKKAREIAAMMPTIGESMKRWNKAIAAAAKSNQPHGPAVRAATTNLITHLKDAGLTESGLRQIMGSVPAGADQDQQKP